MRASTIVVKESAILHRVVVQRIKRRLMRMMPSVMEHGASCMNRLGSVCVVMAYRNLILCEMNCCGTAKHGLTGIQMLHLIIGKRKHALKWCAKESWSSEVFLYFSCINRILA